MAYVDVDKAIKKLESNCVRCVDYLNCTHCHVDKAIKGLKNLPTADVVEVKHGKWQKRGNEKTCSVCKFIYYSNNDEWNYCPNCGAIMDGRKEADK